MKITKYIIQIVLLVAILYCTERVQAQEAMHAQSVAKQEYLNPAYNSFKDYISVNLLNRTQWVGVGNHPNIYGANFYMPIQMSRLGVGLTFLNESIGLRNVTAVSASLTHNIRLSMRSFLSFGYGVGAEMSSYDRNKIIAKDDDYLLYDIDWSLFNPAIKLGVFYTDPHFFVGVSSNTVMGRNNDESWYLPGFDFVCGAMYRLSRSVFFRPDLIIKYYRNEHVEFIESSELTKYVPPVFDLSASFLLKERLWLGTSHRFKQAQTFSADFLVSRNVQLGYSFEWGIGKGLNQFDTHSISLAFKIIPGKALGGFQRQYRYNVGNMFNYLYR